MLIAILAVLALPISCSAHRESDAGGISKDLTMTTNEQGAAPKLTFDVRLTGKELEINYKIKNHLKVPIYLFSVLWEMNEMGAFPAEQQAYVKLKSDSTLLIAKKIPQLPLLMTVEFREIPYVRKVEAGEEYTEKILLKVPVDEFNPYYPKGPESETEEAIAEQVSLEVQYIRGSEELKLTETKIEGAWSVWHPNLFGNVEDLTAAPSAVAVKVNKRKDEVGDL